MGYESTIFVVRKSQLKMDNNLFYANRLAAFELGKLHTDIVSELKSYPYTDCFIYSVDGNTEIIEDRYDEQLREISLPIMLEIIEKAEKNGVATTNLMCMKSYVESLLLYQKKYNLGNDSGLVSLHFGH